MPSTTLKLPEELKRRVARLIEDSDTTMHAFLVRAVERATEAAERRARFVEAALSARANVARSRRGHSMEDVAAWARKRAAGSKVRRPRTKSWR